MQETSSPASGRRLKQMAPAALPLARGTNATTLPKRRNRLPCNAAEVQGPPAALPLAREGWGKDNKKKTGRHHRGSAPAPGRSPLGPCRPGQAAQARQNAWISTPASCDLTRKEASRLCLKRQRRNFEHIEAKRARATSTNRRCLTSTGLNGGTNQPLAGTFSNFFLILMQSDLKN